ncbi:MAG: hypothetical protein AB8G99_06880 [Planctomycetaceae bacterium]
MSALKPFILGSLLSATAVYVSLQYHVVHSNDGFYLVPRTPQASLGLAYADVRDMSKEDIAALPELARAMSAQEARKLLAKADSPTKEGSSLLDGTELFDDARERLQSSDDWDNLSPKSVPSLPNNSLEAPIWNPFQDDGEAPALDTSEDDFGSIPWPELEDEMKSDPDPVAAQFDTGESPFADITEAVAGNSSEGTGGFEEAIENVADELDRARDSFASRTRDLADQFQQRNDEIWSKKPESKPFDFTSQPTFTTGRVQAPVPIPREAVTSNKPVTSGTIPQLRDQNQELRNSLNQRAREIYERARRRAAQPIDSLIDRSESRAASVIDELVSPRKSTEALDRAATSKPSRYTRPQR